jgi:predicted nucleotidyltransferase
MSTDHGLSDATVEGIRTALAEFPQVERAVLYGSRAKGNHKPGSDIDLALFGDQLDHRILGRIDSELDDLLLPYKIDISIFAHITHSDLIEHIRRVGVVFYQKQAAAVKS